MFFHTSRASRISTFSLPPSVSSLRMTESAPPGIGAPVMMRIASPRVSGLGANSPAAIVAMTRSFTGSPLITGVMSAERTAYPSMEELLHGGIVTVAVTSSANTRPRAWRNGTVSGASAFTSARIRSLASATVSMESSALPVRGQRGRNLVGNARHSGARSGRVVGEYAEDEALAIRGCHVSGQRPSLGKSSGLSVDIALGRRFLHAGIDGTVDARDRHGVVESRERCITLDSVEHPHDGLWC